MHEVLVVGGGPAGRALAAACTRRGLDTALLDPAPRRVRRHTYGAWRFELPPDLPGDVMAAAARGVVVARSRTVLERDYIVLDNTALHRHLDPAALTVRAGRALRQRRQAVELADGTVLRAAVVVDATGAPPARGALAAEQTAYGVVVPAPQAVPLLAPGQAVFMDWRADHGRPGWPTFLYAVPLDADRVLLEETSLARRPGLGLHELRRRLEARLAAAGVIPEPDAPRERVRFRVDAPVRGRLSFGATAPLVHPATGFSVAAALRLAPRVAQALAEGLEVSPATARRAVTRTVWSPRALAVHGLRRRGLEVLLRLEPQQVPDFFELFFALPPHLRWAYLSDREDPAAAAAAMSALFAAAPWSLRRSLIAGATAPRRRSREAGRRLRR